MILIIGSSHDDVLYYETLLSKKHNELLFDKYPVTFGRLFNQDIALVSEVYTNYISSVITSYFIDKYFVILAVSVGTCVGYSKNVQFGDIVLSRQVMLSDVDQIAVRPVSLGQIPNGFPSFFKSEVDIRTVITNALNTRTTHRYIDGTFFSSNTFYTREAQLEPLKINGTLTAQDNDVVFDCTFGGVALACQMNHVAFVALKVVETNLGHPMDYQEYSQVLSVYVEVGKVIASSIGDIGRTDILEG